MYAILIKMNHLLECTCCPTGYCHSPMPHWRCHRWPMTWTHCCCRSVPHDWHQVSVVKVCMCADGSPAHPQLTCNTAADLTCMMYTNSLLSSRTANWDVSHCRMDSDLTINTFHVHSHEMTRCCKGIWCVWGQKMKALLRCWIPTVTMTTQLVFTSLHSSSHESVRRSHDPL